ncbi:MAG: hypothetical protein AMR96_02430 [Candidatus Adiutrix intracellularis]|nr:MAG: hypothetical protein AMR96_02430 [Candidatus Adiutrix intracellularis]
MITTSISVHNRFKTKADTTTHNKLKKYGGCLRNDAFKVPERKEVNNLTRHFYKDTALYLCFIANLEIEVTNNLAKQIINFVVLDKIIT